MGRHQPGEIRHMICFESVAEATAFDLIVLDIRHLGPLPIENDDAIQRVVLQLDQSQAQLPLNLVVEAHGLHLRHSLLH